MTTNQNSTPVKPSAGDAAKLREALAQQSVNDADTAARILDERPEDVCEERMSWSELCDMVHNLADGFTTLRNAVNTALAAPPRNCDTPAVVNGAQAWAAFKRHNPDAYFDVPGLLRCIDWLFALATEKKGEKDETQNSEAKRVRDTAARPQTQVV